MKKCPTCNAELPDDAEFCNNCGAKLNAEEAAPVAEPVQAPAAPENNGVLEAAKEASKNTQVGLIAVIAAAAVLVIVLIIVLVSSASNAYKKPLKNYFAALSEGDFKSSLEASIPKEIESNLLEELDYDVDYDEYTDLFDEAYKAAYDALKEEGKVEFVYEIKNVENIDKLDKLEDDADERYDIKDLDDFRDYMEDCYDDYDFDGDKVKDCYFCEVKWELDIDGDREAKNTVLVFLYKYDGKWYADGSLPSYFDIFDGYSDSSLDSDDFEDAFEEFEDAMEDVYDELY